MVVGICIAISQVGITSAYLGLASETAGQFEKRINTGSPEAEWLRDKLYGSKDELSAISICRWATVNGREEAPSPECAPSSLDLRVRTADPQNPAIAEISQHFLGNVERIHICKECAFETAVLIELDQEPRQTLIQDLAGIGILTLVDASKKSEINSHFISAKLLIEKLESVAGTVLFSPPGVLAPINMSEATKTMLLIINTSLLVVIALWLSLRGHRRVLDYFARNDSLLPLVASCGKSTFYSAIWIITLFRVGFFLLMVTPATIVAFAQVAPSSTLNVFMHNRLDFILWLFALLSSLSSLTIIASIAELKHRCSWVSFLYRYVPMIVCVVGTLLWFVSLFLQPGAATIVRNTIASCPILGISPVLLSPLIALSPTLLAAHAILASVMVIGVMRKNSRWFAAHLEEL